MCGLAVPPKYKFYLTGDKARFVLCVVFAGEIIMKQENEVKSDTV